MHDLFAIGEVAEPEPVDRVRMPPTSSASSSHISRSIHSSGFDRRVHDFYATPNWVTEALLRHVQFRGRVWEPCCGTGAITSVLQRHGYDVTSTDIADHGFGTPGVDFLSCRARARGLSGARHESALWRQHSVGQRPGEVLHGNAALCGSRAALNRKYARAVGAVGAVPMGGRAAGGCPDVGRSICCSDRPDPSNPMV